MRLCFLVCFIIDYCNADVSGVLRHEKLTPYILLGRVFNKMKQENIVRQKMWDAKMNNKAVYFPTSFYSQKDVLNGLNTFDIKNVKVNLRFGKTEKGFDAYIVSFP